MRKSIMFFFYFFFVYNLSSQITNIIPTSTSIAQTSVADSRNWSAFNNPAMLGNLQRTEVVIQLDNRYLVKELNTKSLQLAFANHIVNTGLSFSHFGYSLYHEMIYGLSFARNFSNVFSMGVQFNYYSSYFISSNSYRGALLPQIGLSVKLNPEFSIGFQSFNPFQTNIQTEYTIKRISSIFSLGSEYFFSPEFSWRTQMDKEISSNYRFATAFDYQMVEQMKIKLGIYGSDYLVPCLGVGFKNGRMGADLNCELHPLLGLNTMVALKYEFGK